MRGRYMNKDNVAWWFLAIACLVVWGLVAAAYLGFLRLDGGVGALVSGWNLGRLKLLAIYLAIINTVSFAAFAWDKHVAANGNDLRKRLPEARLLGLSLLGGAVGGMLAMRILRHKTRKRYFVWGLPLFIALHLATLGYAHMGGLI